MGGNTLPQLPSFAGGEKPLVSYICARTPPKVPKPKAPFFPWELSQEQKQGAVFPQLLLGSSWHNLNDFFHVPKRAGMRCEAARASFPCRQKDEPALGPRDGMGQGEWDDGRAGRLAAQLALIKAWQHSLRPTALFTLASGERARMAFANLVAGSICPGSIAASGE